MIHRRHQMILAGILLIVMLSTISNPGLTDNTVEDPDPQAYLPSLSRPRVLRKLTLTPGELIFIEADQNIIYNWFVYVPKSLQKNAPSYIWVSGLHGYCCDYDEATEVSRQMALGRVWKAEESGYILLVPVIPRTACNGMAVYAVALPWNVFLESLDPYCKRPDEKLNLMIDTLAFSLREEGFVPRDRIFMDGYSAGGMFAQRYAVLHPERVNALAAGHCGGAITFPEPTYEDFNMDWPVGTYDYQPNMGQGFATAKYKQIHQFIYIGEDDVINSTLYAPGEVYRTQAQLDFLKGTFGELSPGRIENQVSYLNGLGYNNITFKLYPGVGHEITSEMVDDTYAFFSSHE